METKDYWTLGMSGLALFVSMISVYFNIFYKPAKAMVLMLQRDYSPETRESWESYPLGYKCEPLKTNVTYSVSNTGMQALCIKSVEVLRGPSLRGNLKDSRSFYILDSNQFDSFILQPGEIQVVKVSYKKESVDVDIVINPYRLFSLEIVSSTGDRYQVCHDITNLNDASALHHPIWDGLELGRPIRSDGFV
jgi:hypothetical protein